MSCKISGSLDTCPGTVSHFWTVLPTDIFFQGLETPTLSERLLSGSQSRFWAVPSQSPQETLGYAFLYPSVSVCEVLTLGSRPWSLSTPPTQI